jgi:hypothetical protein
MAKLGVVRMKRWRPSPPGCAPNAETGAAIGFYGVPFAMGTLRSFDRWIDFSAIWCLGRRRRSER